MQEAGEVQKVVAVYVTGAVVAEAQVVAVQVVGVKVIAVQEVVGIHVAGWQEPTAMKEVVPEQRLVATRAAALGEESASREELVLWEVGAALLAVQMETDAM